ncbi:protein ACCELERATED CELL DEATH 6 isoform X1 [Eucalyptus grandis]|uniref:protein ACCELERATED CELL DEATH 6 isoform X1 n=1 Tax=Eucalyptus grandis TaxID=71139 RepID=UPI00192EDF5B|nr:protein ACCELERATED CELL DEATH 6 isoform X1 [Eucalyptus grandis]XP_010024292.2 protein ACCELERATED CELL DEATH 6 isoform X1 [Eucalyptus grandis]XP_010024293.2 protein ACCELERATED CELL DEATH 6 isoform X1 [Eucalyptus grandis]
MAGESGEGDVDNFIEAPGKYSAEERGPLVRDYKRTGPFWEIVPPHRSRHQEWLIRDMRRTTKANFQGDTALHVAARAGKIHTAKLLLDSDGIVGMANNAGNTALHEAVKNSHYELTRMLLNRGSNLVYEENRERKCPLYLAVEMGDLRSLVLLMEAVDGEKVSLLEGMSPVHGAVMHERIEMLKEMSKQKKELFYLSDVGGGTPLHLAAYANYIDGVKFLVNEFTSSAVEYDKEGYLPIHIACKMGHLETIKELIQHWPFPEELLNFKEGQNILHVAAKYGRASIVKYILGNLELEKLINVKDKEGNTPLHLATLQWQPEVLLSLTRDNRVDLKLVNNGNLTALDIVDEQLKKVDAPLQQSITRTILLSAGAPRSKDKAICQSKDLGQENDLEPLDLDRLKDEINSHMVVATVIAAMTFAAGFSIFGAYNDSEPDAGITTLLNKPMYDVFVICNTVAMFSSIISIVIILWRQINDSHAVLHALEKARQPLLTALATMSMAFMAGVYVTVSKCTWIAILALIIGSTALFVILSLYMALFVPLGYNCRLVQFFADYIIRAGISISRSVTVERATWQPHYPLGILNPSAGCPEIDPIPATNVIDGNSKY